MEPVVLNDDGESNNELFFIDVDRAKEILDHMAEAGINAVNNFKEQYEIVAVVKLSEENNGELMHRLNVSKLLREMLSIAGNENEKNFILYSAHFAIEHIRKIIHRKKY